MEKREKRRKIRKGSQQRERRKEEGSRMYTGIEIMGEKLITPGFKEDISPEFTPARGGCPFSSPFNQKPQ